MKTVKIKSTLRGVSLAQPRAKRGVRLGGEIIIFAIQEVPNEVLAFEVINAFNKTIINRNPKKPILFNELGFGRVVN